MQCVKLLSKIARNAGRDSILHNHPFSPFFKPNSNTSYQHPFSKYNFWNSTNISGVSGGIRDGVLSSSVLGRRIFSNILLKGQTKGWASGSVGIPPKRYFHSFDSQFHGWKSVFRRFSPDGIVIGLIIANVAVFILWRVANPLFMLKNFTITVDNIANGRLHTLITSAFSHRDTWHLISNMIGLYFFGLSVGRIFGSENLLKLYLSGAVVGSIFFLAYHALVAPSFQNRQVSGIDHSKVFGLGASGAVNAIMLLDIFLFPTKTLYLDFIIPIPAILLGIFIIGRDTLRILERDNQVSGSAHLGGAVVAALAWTRIKRGRFHRF